MPGPFSVPEDIAIRLPPGQRRRFVATDGVSGWYDGCTHASTLGGGYMPRDRFVLASWSSAINGRPLDRDAKALGDSVFPWGHRVDYREGCEEVVLHNPRRILSLRVSAPLPAGFSIELRWCEADAGREWQTGGDYRWSAPPPEGTAGSSTAPDPHPLWIARFDERCGDSLTCHLVFGESPDEMLALLGLVRQGGSFERERQARWESLNESWLATGIRAYDKALWWAAASARSLVTGEFGTGIWAGLPWFKDNWGRDTFIALPGTLLCTGQFATAKAVLDDFARRQNLDPDSRDFGRIPNRVTASQTIYNTVDGTPWLIRELDDYLRWTGDLAFVRRYRPLIRQYVEGALRYFVDPEGFLTHDDADTWMDARIANDTPWSPRGDRAAEIQALWFCALLIGARLAGDDGDAEEARWYRNLAGRVKLAFAARFVVDGHLVDHLDVDGQPDQAIRPNTLLVATIPPEDLVEPAVLRASARRTCEALLLPWGILSLAADHPDFHPWHENPPRWHKDAAYHNGTVWGWNAGFAVSALVRQGWQERAWRLSRHLAGQILDLGAIGTMSELLDACPGPDGQPVPSGTFSQAWSVSEFVRNAWEDYLGLRPGLDQGRLVFRPALPLDWPGLAARVRFGESGVLEIAITQTMRSDGARCQDWSFHFASPQAEQASAVRPGLRVEFRTAGGEWCSETAPDRQDARLRLVLPSVGDDAPAFAPAPEAEACPVMRAPDVLMTKLQPKNAKND